LTAFYRLRFAACKIAHLGFTGEEKTKDIYLKLNGRPVEDLKVEIKFFRPIDKMNPQESSVFLKRTFLFLDAHIPNWMSTAFGSKSDNFSLNPYENDPSTNQQILHHLVTVFGDSLKEEELMKNKWPPLAKNLEDFDFIDTVIYIQLIILHLSGYKPDIGDPEHRPSYWGRIWGIPLNALSPNEWADQWSCILGIDADPNTDYIAKWVEEQTNIIAQVADIYASSSWREPDEQRYVSMIEHNFPYLGRHYLYDLIALKRFRCYTEIYSPNKHKIENKDVIKDLFSRFPCLPITLAELTLTVNDTRGFILELGGFDSNSLS
jgi:hypothetical protein